MKNSAIKPNLWYLYLKNVVNRSIINICNILSLVRKVYKIYKSFRVTKALTLNGFFSVHPVKLDKTTKGNYANPIELD